MTARPKASNSQPLLRTLAEFRYELREFLHFSERAAVDAGLLPQQHQLLLQVAGAPEGEALTIAFAAKRLGLRHHSAVELVDRSVRKGLLVRTADPVDRRRAILELTRTGEQIMDRLARDHARELKVMAPRLAKALARIRTSSHHSGGSKTR